jgi:hypothetical protein
VGPTPKRAPTRLKPSQHRRPTPSETLTRRPARNGAMCVPQTPVRVARRAYRCHGSRAPPSRTGGTPAIGARRLRVDDGKGSSSLRGGAAPRGARRFVKTAQPRGSPGLGARPPLGQAMQQSRAARRSLVLRNRLHERQSSLARLLSDVAEGSAEVAIAGEGRTRVAIASLWQSGSWGPSSRHACSRSRGRVTRARHWPLASPA